MNKYAIWDLEKYKVDEPNKYSNVVDKNTYFDFWNREVAIRELFESTSDPDVKQVLRFAMELNNHYRQQAMDFYNAWDGVHELLKGALELTNQAVNKAYL